MHTNGITHPQNQRLGFGPCLIARSLVPAFIAAALVAPLPGAPRPALTPEQLKERAAAEEEKAQDTHRNAIRRLLNRGVRKVESAKVSGKQSVLDILAMSGGGDFGAFGAGFLVGWGSSTKPDWRRPDFDAVTGVSTGALLAPFAYVGTDEACRIVESFYRNPRAGWVKQRGLLFFLPSKPSFMIVRELESDLGRAVNHQLTAQIAAQSKRGKLLFVTATDLDFGRQKLWDVGREAESAMASGNWVRLHRILMASAAIPGVFPPVELDGGVTANVLLRLDPKSPDALLPQWKRMHSDMPLPKVRYWLIINNQLNQPPRTVQVRWPSVLSPSLSTAIRSSTFAEVRWLASQADYVNASMGTNIEVRVTAIPDDWRPPVPGDFKKETMVSLSELGRQMGASPNSWTLWTAPLAQKGE